MALQALEQTIATLGKPLLVRALGAPSALKAAIARWRHSETLVEVVPSGSIRLAASLIDGKNARDRSGYSSLNQAHGASLSVLSPTEGTSIEVHGEADVLQLFLAQDFAEAMLDAPFVCPPMFDLRDDWMRTIMMRSVVHSARRGPDDSLMVEEDLYALAFRLERHANQWRDRSVTPSTLFRGGLAPAAFRRIEAMIAAALDEATSPSVADMAEAVGLSITYFTRAFRRHTGNTPYNYLIRRRMDRAISLLSGTKIPVAEVADTVGFSTPAHFIASFRTAVGVTPGALREALSG